MPDMVPPILAFLVATSVTLLELITSKYPRTFFLMKKSCSCYIYSIVYGFIAFFIMLGLDSLVKEGVLKLEGLGLSYPVVQALAVGLTIKAFLHIRLFNIVSGAQSFPVGIESIVQLFEPWLIRTTELYHFNASANYITLHSRSHSDLEKVKKTIKDNLPPTLTSQEKTAFQADIDRVTNVFDAMILYLSTVGKKSFERVFPKDNPS